MTEYITVNWQDLYDAVRVAIKEALTTDANKVEDEPQLWGEAHDAALACLAKLKVIPTDVSECPHCDGHGWMPDVAASECLVCRGSGVLDGDSAHRLSVISRRA